MRYAFRMTLVHIDNGCEKHVLLNTGTDLRREFARGDIVRDYWVGTVTLLSKGTRIQVRRTLKLARKMLH